MKLDTHAIAELGDARAALAAVIADSASAVLLLRADGSVLVRNDSFRRLFGELAAERPVIGGPAGVAVREALGGATVRVARHRWDRADLGHGGAGHVVVDGVVRPLCDAGGAVTHVLLTVERSASVEPEPAGLLAGLPERGSVLGDQIDRIIQLVPAAVYIGDMSGMRFVNGEGLRQLGFRTLGELHADVESLASRIETRHVYTGEPVTVDEQVFVRALRGEVSSSDVLIKHLLSGEERVVHCVAAPLRHGGVTFGAIAINSDVTDERRFTEARHLAERALAVERLAGGLAHDFNNLSMAALGFLHLALEGLSGDDRRRALLSRVLEAVERGAAIGADLLALTGRRALRLERVDVRHWARRAEQVLSPTIAQRSTWRDGLPAEGEVVVRADPVRLDEVLGVLLSNGAQVTPPDGTVTVTVSAAPRAVRVSVSDRGPPLEDAHVRRAFEPYHAIPGRRSDLALASLRGVVEQMGGSVGITPGGSSNTFWFELPRSPALASAQAPVVGPAEGGTILVVEDEPSVREVLRRLLSAERYPVLVAADGVEALGILRADPGDVRLVVSDILMPRMDGRELLAAIQHEFSGMPVILMSGDPGVDDPVGRQRPTPIAFLQKPFPPEELLALVRERVVPLPS